MLVGTVALMEAWCLSSSCVDGHGLEAPAEVLSAYFRTSLSDFYVFICSTGD